MFKKCIVSFLCLSIASIASDFTYRKYLHVKEFYQGFAKDATKICLDYGVPPAAVLAIAGVESGYGRGYVSRISGNILSLGAKKSDFRLPPLYLPNLKNDPSKILYAEQISHYKNSELRWKKREASLKKDYRPENIAGTTKELDYFDKHPKQKKEANLQCIRDFVKEWINKNRKYKPYVQARMMLDNAIKKHSKKILFDRNLNIRFLQAISGKKNSFNYRKSWASKVVQVIDNAGLIELTKALHVKKQSFAQVWNVKIK